MYKFQPIIINRFDKISEGCDGHDSIVVKFISTYAISAYHTNIVSSNPAHDGVYLIQHYAIKFVSDL